jgi:hypothetical protein
MKRRSRYEVTPIPTVYEEKAVEIIFNNLNWLPSNINIDVNLLTKGSDLLTYQENITIFKHAFKYIKDSKRFTSTNAQLMHLNL